jgi:subtilisin family serine protease
MADQEVVPALPGPSVEEMKEELLDQIIVFSKEPSKEILGTLGQLALKSLEKLADMYLISGKFNSTIIKPLIEAGIISYTEPDYIVRASNVSVDVQISPPNWGLSRIDKRYLPLSFDFHYPSSAGKNVTVYILDTGITTTHRDLEGRARFGVDFINNNKTQDDDNGHGTFVAGLVGGARYGVAKSCSMVSVKVLNSGGIAPSSVIIRGIQYVISQHQSDPDNMSILK